MPRINVLYEGIAITKSIRKCGIFRDHDSGDATHYRVSLLVEYAFSADLLFAAFATLRTSNAHVLKSSGQG
jgi:hypothetical protein